MFWSFYKFFFYKISQTSQKLFDKIVKIRALDHSSLSSLVEIKYLHTVQKTIFKTGWVVIPSCNRCLHLGHVMIPEQCRCC